MKKGQTVHRSKGRERKGMKRERERFVLKGWTYIRKKGQTAHRSKGRERKGVKRENEFV